LSRSSDVAARYDRISDLYDETREPLTPQGVEEVVGFLAREGAKEVLEVGVGTGRIAAPIRRRAVSLVGIDLSRRMLERAKAKGLDNLALADANQLPFKDAAFDAVLIAHVLHLFESPAETLGRLSRVARKEILVIFRRRDEGNPVLGPARQELWQRFREAAEELSCELPPPSGDYLAGFKRESAFLAEFPPDEVEVVQDVLLTTTLGERLSVFEKRAYGFPVQVSDEAFQRIVAKVRSEIDPGKQFSYRRVEQVGVWRKERLAALEGHE